MCVCVFLVFMSALPLCVCVCVCVTHHCVSACVMCPQDIVDEWLLAQQKWMYLGPVYGSEEIAKQMPKVTAASLCHLLLPPPQQATSCVAISI